MPCYADWAAQEQDDEGDEDDEAAEGQTLTRGPAFASLLAAGHERDAALGVAPAPACGNDWTISAVHRDHSADGDTGSRREQETTGAVAAETGKSGCLVLATTAAVLLAASPCFMGQVLRQFGVQPVHTYIACCLAAGEGPAVTKDGHKRERDCVFEDGSDAWSPV